jgi:hypothetical protein
MKLLLSALGLALAAQISNAWIAVSPVDRNSNTVDIFELDDTGAKTKDVLTFQVSSGETIDPNAFACGRYGFNPTFTVPMTRLSRMSAGASASS